MVIGDKTFPNRNAAMDYLEMVLEDYADKEVLSEEYSPMLFAMVEKLGHKKGKPIHYIRHNAGKFVKIKAVWEDGTVTMSYRNMMLRWNRWAAYLKCSESKKIKKTKTIGRPPKTKSGQSRKFYTLNGFRVLGAQIRV